MLIAGFGFLLDTLTNYYILSVLTTVFALAGTYFVCFHHHKQTESNLTDIADKISAADPASAYEQDASKITEECSGCQTDVLLNEAKQDGELGADIKKPAKLAEMVIKSGMSDEQIQQEKRAQREQLAEIFKLMQQQSDKFGSVTITDVEEQMKLYR